LRPDARYPRARALAVLPHPVRPVRCDAGREGVSHRASTRPSRETGARCLRRPTLMSAQLLLPRGRNVVRLWIPSVYAGTRAPWTRPNGIIDAPQSPAFQSLAQMNVPQHHCVPVSLWPEGPMGAGAAGGVGDFESRMGMGSWRKRDRRTLSTSKTGGRG
jgi:hypothetical protein